MLEQKYGLGKNRSFGFMNRDFFLKNRLVLLDIKHDSKTFVQSVGALL